MSVKDHFTVTRTRVPATPENIRDFKYRAACANILLAIAIVTEVISLTGGPGWGLWVTAGLALAAVQVYFRVTVTVTSPGIERWKARRAQRSDRD